MTDMPDATDFDVPDRGPSAETRTAIRAAVSADLAPLPAISVRARARVVFGAATLSCVLAVASFGFWAAVGALSHASELLVGVVAIAAATVTVVVALAPAKGARLEPWKKLLATAVIVGAWFTHLVYRSTAGLSLATGVEPMALGCAAKSVIAGLFTTVVVLRVWRHTDPWSPRSSGALIGTGAGAVACAGIGIACASPEGGHLLVGHGLAVVLLGLLGVLASRRVLAP